MIKNLGGTYVALSSYCGLHITCLAETRETTALHTSKIQTTQGGVYPKVFTEVFEEGHTPLTQGTPVHIRQH